MADFVILLECFGICLTIIAMLLLLNGDGAREQKMLIITLCGSLVQNAGYLLELTAPGLEAAMTAVTVENIGSVFVYVLLHCPAQKAVTGAQCHQLFCAASGVL